MPVIVQSADEDSADEAALLARIVALETAVADLTATNTDLVARLAALETLTVDLTEVRDRAAKADAALTEVAGVLAAAYPAN